MGQKNTKKDSIEDQVKSADDSVRLIIDNLLRKGNKYAIEFDGKSGCGVRLWSVVTLLSVYLERYMPEKVIKEFVQKKELVEEREKEIKQETNDPSKRQRKINKMKYRIGVAGFEACVRVYINSPIITQDVKSMLDAQNISTVKDYKDAVQRIRDEDHRIELFPQRVEDV